MCCRRSSIGIVRQGRKGIVVSFAPLTPPSYFAPSKIAADTWVIHQVQPALGQPLFVYLNSWVILGAEPIIVDTGTPANREQWLSRKGQRRRCVAPRRLFVRLGGSIRRTFPAPLLQTVEVSVQIREKLRAALRRCDWPVGFVDGLVMLASHVPYD